MALASSDVMPVQHPGILEWYGLPCKLSQYASGYVYYRRELNGCLDALPCLPCMVGLCSCIRDPGVMLCSYWHGKQPLCDFVGVVMIIDT